MSSALVGASTLFKNKEFRMKCVKNTEGKVERVGEEKAADRVKTGEWRYCSKSEWKAAARDKE